MTSPLALALALPGEGLEESVLATFEQARSFDVRRRCLELEDLLGLAQSGQLDVALIAGTVLRWDGDVVARLQSCGVCVIALATDQSQEQRFRQWAVDAVMTLDVRAFDAVDVVTEVTRVVTQTRSRNDGHPHSFAHDVSSRSLVDSVAQTGDPFAPNAGDSPQGKVIAVWGPTGAPGRSTTGLGIASALAQRDHRVLLIDADPYGGALALMLGRREPDTPGLASACRLAHHGRLTQAQLIGLVHHVEPGLDLMTGLLRADRWPELRPAALDQVWSLARDLWDLVVIDVGFCLEEDEELSYDSMVPRRNATTISALTTADHIVAVGSIDAIGLTRLVRGLDDLKQVVGRDPSVVVANRGMGRSRQVAVQRQVKEILRETRHDAPVLVLPFDRDACSKALHAGRSLIHVAPQSALTKNLHLLAHTLGSHSGGEHDVELGDRTALGRLRRLSA